MNITLPSSEYLLGLAGYAISALWLLLGAAVMLAMAGAAGIGVGAGATLLPQLLAASMVAASVIAVAAVRPRATIGVAVAGGILAILIVATLDQWHPDYRPLLRAAAVLSVVSLGWGMLAYMRASQGAALR